MIFRLSQKLNAKIKAGALAAQPLDENPFADWSASLFIVRRSQYILVSNTKSLYSTVLPGQGVTNHRVFVETALRSIRERLEADGQEGVHECHSAPASGSVRFARALNRSVTGFMNELIRDATVWLADGDRSLHDVSGKLNDVLLSALAPTASLRYGKPGEAFKALSSPPASRPRTDGGDAGG
jgi:hypothetical protein